MRRWLAGSLIIASSVLASGCDGGGEKPASTSGDTGPRQQASSTAKEEGPRAATAASGNPGAATTSKADDMDPYGPAGATATVVAPAAAASGTASAGASATATLPPMPKGVRCVCAKGDPLCDCH